MKGVTVISTAEENYQTGVSTCICKEPETHTPTASLFIARYFIKKTRLSIIFSADLTIQISSTVYYEKSPWHLPNCGTFALPTAK